MVSQGLIGLLVKLASGSILAFRTLFELRVSSILKDVLSTYDPSQGMVSPNMMVDGHCNQVCTLYCTAPLILKKCNYVRIWNFLFDFF